MNIYYVYMYSDPITNEPFYIGKGKNYRDKAHLKPSVLKNGKNVNTFFYSKLNSLIAKGLTPNITRVFENLSESEALDKELELILQYGCKFVGDKNGILLNIVTDRGPTSKKKIIWSEERKQKYKEYHKNKRLQILKEDLYEMFVTKNMSRKEIATVYNCSEVLIKVRLREYDIIKPLELRKLPIEAKQFKCSFCEKIFISQRKKKKYCSKKCAGMAKRGKTGFKVAHEDKICLCCNSPFNRTNTHVNRHLNKKYCSKACSLIGSIINNLDYNTIIDLYNSGLTNNKISVLLGRSHEYIERRTKYGKQEGKITRI